MDLDEAEDAAASGSAIKVAAASEDRATFERDCEKWRERVRKKREEGGSNGLLRCAVCTSGKTFATLHALMDHARYYKKQSQLEHSAYRVALREVEMDMGCKEEQNPGLPAESLPTGAEGGKRKREEDASKQVQNEASQPCSARSSHSFPETSPMSGGEGNCGTQEIAVRLEKKVKAGASRSSADVGSKTRDGG
jgi:hypothetical protein